MPYQLPALSATYLPFYNLFYLIICLLTLYLLYQLPVLSPALSATCPTYHLLYLLPSVYYLPYLIPVLTACSTYHLP